MREVHLRNLDLNLLQPLHALLEERHVTRAAKRSFLSQPAMSRALERLREMFGDPLLVRSGRGYERTVRGERVLRALDVLMPRLEGIVRGEEFDPARSQERFRVALTDHASTTLLPSLVARLRKAAAHIKLEVSTWRTEAYEDVAAGRLDIALSAEEVPPALESEVILDLDFVCLVGSAQRMRSRRLTLKQYLQFPHALVERWLVNKPWWIALWRSSARSGTLCLVFHSLCLRSLPSLKPIWSSLCRANWQRLPRGWLVCGSLSHLARSRPFRISWPGTRDSLPNWRTHGFANNCG